MQTHSLQLKSQDLRTAVTLLWISLAIDVATTLADWSTKSAGDRELLLPITMAGYGFVCLLINAISDGKSWARKTYLAILIITVPTWLYMLLYEGSSMSKPGLMFALDGAELALQIYAAVLLFRTSPE